ncbi:MAG: transketolase [Armatimonadetes bacterium]|nr:transketolase [Armatimonadota bacterium]
MNELDQLCIDSLRFLAVDAVEAANSGHPGLPLGAAPMAYAIFDRFLRFNPANPGWFNRDRFILSAGHGSALLYALLHSFGYDVSLEQVKQFRQWGSITPGHPEYGLTPGVECTTGPLGQGFAMGVGMAMAERFLAARYNTPEATVVDHYTYAIVSDGDLMEGVASEAASLAGHLRLGKLIYLYDDNEISIEGSTDLAFTEDVPARFAAYGWHLQDVADGNDLDAICAAIEAAQAETERPSLIVVHTTIGCGSPKAGTAGVHGEPLGAEAMAATRECYAWPKEPFFMPDEARDHMGEAVERGLRLEAEWSALCDRAAAANPDLMAEFRAAIAGELPAGWTEALPVFPADKEQATRNASGVVLNALGEVLPNLLGGSADLSPSNKSDIRSGGEFGLTNAECGRNIHFGVREHAMGAIVNGMALHGGVIPYGATFLIFSDYLRPALRLAALQEAHSLFIFTHDSIGVGEDGPTHQPIEQIMSLRLIPHLMVYRPADANETAQCWKLMIERKEPALIALTRQNLPTLDVERYPVRQGVPRGAYVLSEPEGDPQVILLATGSEVSLALAAQEVLAAESVRARVVSMPCWELFEAQPECYQCEVLPPGIPRVAIEAGATIGWQRWVGSDGAVIGLNRFGASAPAKTVFKELGFTIENVVQTAKGLLEA